MFRCHNTAAVFLVLLLCNSGVQGAPLSDTTWLNWSWNVVSSRDAAQFFRLVGPQSDTGYRICDYFLNGRMQERGYALDAGGAVKTGYTIRWDSLGRHTQEGPYHKGNREGLWRFYRNGGEELRSEEWYHNGKRDGPYRKYDWKTGALYQLGQLKAGTPVGLWKVYYRGTSLLFQQCNFVDGNQEGPMTQYWPNGRAKRMEYYKKGRFIKSKQQCFDSTGAPTSYTPYQQFPDFVFKPKHLGELVLATTEGLATNEVKDGAYSLRFTVTTQGAVEDFQATAWFQPVVLGLQILFRGFPLTPMLEEGNAIEAHGLFTLQIENGRTVSWRYSFHSAEDDL